MPKAMNLVEVWRGDLLESVHRGHAVVSDAKGQIRASWGNPDEVILPRSSCKMIQALPLIESGAAAKYGLESKHLALACASHDGAAIHTDPVTEWLADLNLGETDLRCGPQPPTDMSVRHELIRSGGKPCQVHNNCSGKHAGFLTLNKYLGGSADYVEIDHPVQKAAKLAFEEMTGLDSPGFGIDGCSAPNFATTVLGLATSMAKMADPSELGDVRETAARALVSAMMQHPQLVAGTTRACTELMQAANGVAIKTGAEGVYVAILPAQGLGVALKIEDGATRAAESAIAAILVRLGVLSADHPSVIKRLCPPILNRRKMDVGFIRPDAEFYANGISL